MSPHRLAVSFLVASLLLILPATADAQTLTERFGDLFTFGDCGQALCLEADLERNHGDHYIPEVVQGEQNTLAFLRAAIVAGLTGVPAAAANGGVMVRFVDGRLLSEEISPGPIFAERAQTLGTGVFLAGSNVTGLSFSNLRGTPIDDLELTFPHVNVGSPDFGDPLFENDVVRVRSSLAVSLLVTNFYAAFGMTDALDLAASVPVVRSQLTGASRADIISTLENSPHRFEGGTSSAQASASGSSIGVGDISLRAKYRAVEQERWGGALLAEVRLPTGSEENFHGTGSVGFRAMGIASGTLGNFSPHLNLGVALLGSDQISDQIQMVAGFDQLVSPSVTLAIDLLGSWALGDAAFDLPGDIEFDVPQRRTVRSSNISNMSDDRLDGSIGAKFSLPQDTRIITNVLVPLNSGGMRPSFVWSIGVERLF